MCWIGTQPAHHSQPSRHKFKIDGAAGIHIMRRRTTARSVHVTRISDQCLHAAAQADYNLLYRNDSVFFVAQSVTDVRSHAQAIRFLCYA